MKTLIAIACLLAAAPCRADVEPADLIALAAFPDNAGDRVTRSEAPAPSRAARTPTAAITESDLPPDQYPAPMEGVAAGLKALDLKPTDTLADYGCGFDCRWGITAARLYGCKVVAVEIDPAMAASAKRYVEHAGLAHLVTVVTGDATAVSTGANKACAYLWPETAARLPIKSLDRFVSYEFAVPGLPMKAVPVLNGGTIHLWEKPAAQVPVTRTVDRIVRLPRGSYCEVCRGYCSNPMAHRLQTQIVGYQSAAATSGHWEVRRVCQNGVCRNVRVFVSD